MFYIDDETAYLEYKDYLDSKPRVIKVTGDIIETSEYIVKVFPEYADLLTIAEELKRPIVEFDITGYATQVVENQGYKFITFGR